MGYIQRLERVMIKSTANSNVKSTPSTPIRTGGVVGETPTHNLPQFLENRGMERVFDRFPDLLWDDPEDKDNHLIGILRNTIFEYYKI